MMDQNNIKVNTNTQLQMSLLKEICTKHSVNFEALKKMLETEKIKKLHKQNHYISHVIAEIIEG